MKKYVGFRKAMYENAMTESIKMPATCNSCDRIIYEDENWREQYKENGGYCKDCHESEEQETEFYEYLDNEDSDGTFGREPAKDESKEVSHFEFDENGDNVIVTESKEVKEGGELFTKGDWQIQEDEFWHQIYSETPFAIAQIPKKYRSPETIAANAALIAQAPAMFKLIQWISRVTNSPEIGIKCDAMIKKATHKK